MVKKVYVHFEPAETGVAFTTFAIETDANTTLDVLRDKVARLLSNGKSAACLGSSIVLVGENGKAIKSVGATKLDELVDDQEGGVDFFILSTPKVATNDPSASTSTISTSQSKATESTSKPRDDTKSATTNPSSTKADKSTPNKPIATTAASASNGNSVTVSGETLDARRKLEAYMQKKLYTHCKAPAEVLIQANFEKTFALNCLALIGIETKRFDEAIKYGRASLQHDKNNIESYYILGKALHGKGQYEQAVEILENGTKLWKSIKPSAKKGQKDDHLYLDLVALLAESFFADGDHNEAANVLNQVMSNPHCDRNLNILVTYASFAFQYRKLEEAVVALLKSIALKRQDPRISKLAADILCTREGYAEFTRQFPPSSRETAEVYAYMGTTVKDYSAMDTSVLFYQTAMRLQPENPSYALNLAHVYEIKVCLDEAVDTLKAFYTRNATTLGFKPGNPTLCARMLEAMQPVSSSAGRRCLITWVVDSQSSSTTSKSNSSDNEHQRGFCLVEQVSADHHPSADTTGDSSVGDDEEVEVDSPSQRQIASPVPRPDQMYTFAPRDLDLIALYATTVKIFYLKGLLSHLPPMIQCIERVRGLSQLPLHETLVRNELAYYQDIVQILAVRTHAAVYGLPDASFALNDPLKSNKTEFVQARQRPLYICGDSHCLSAAWSILTVHSLPRLVIPKLVTGLKQWHLRPESRFYPKENFFQAVATIPVSSDVIFTVGEIDCREGIVAAVERDHYQSFEQAVRRTVGIFVQVLKDLRKSRKFRVRLAVSS